MDKKIKYVENVVIEKDLLYPLLRGKDLKKWSAKPQYDIILPYTSDGKVMAIEDLRINYPRTYDYFYKKENGFIDILVSRGIYKKHYKSINAKAPEYVLYNIGPYTFSPYKVVWKALASGMISSTIDSMDNRLIIPDHNVVMIPMYDEDEAYYLSGILNTEIVSRFVNAYISWFFSTHILEHIFIPKYDAKNMIHKTIVKLSKEAHICIGQDEIKIKIIENNLNAMVENLLTSS